MNSVFLFSCKRRFSSSCCLSLSLIGSYFALVQTAIVLDAAMCWFFRLAELTESGGAITKGISERCTFEPIVIRILWPQSLGTGGDLNSIADETSYIGILGEGGLHTHGWYVGGLVDWCRMALMSFGICAPNRWISILIMANIVKDIARIVHLWGNLRQRLIT